MNELSYLDYAVIASYFVALIGIAFYFSRRQTTTEVYFIGGGTIPWWAMGISLMAALISSITFIAFPGDAYEKNWSGLVPGLMVPLVLLVAAAIIIPFYRQAVGMSAYQYFEERFGYGARLYSSLSFLLMQFSKMGLVLWLISLALSTMSGWNIYTIIIVLEVITIIYVLFGGIEGVVWTAVLQGAVLAAAGVVCLAVLMLTPPGGPKAVLELAWENGKFSLGGFGFNLHEPTFLVLACYGVSVYIQKYAADQAVVQRYLIAKSNREALRGTVLGALLCIPVWMMFLLIGSCLWAYVQLTGLELPPHVDRADKVFPFFISHELPSGVTGLVLAALIAAAVDPDLNSISVVVVEDYYRRFQPTSTDAGRLRFGKLTVVFSGIVTVLIAMVLARSQGTALSLAFLIAAILSAGVAGLFGLAFLSSRATAGGAYVGIAAGIAFTAWATLTSKGMWDCGRFNYTLHPYLIGVFANLILIVIGYLSSPFFERTVDALPLTIWGWLRDRSRRDMPPERMKLEQVAVQDL